MDLILLLSLESVDLLRLTCTNGDQWLYLFEMEDSQASSELETLVLQVATWEKQIYTCCRDGLVRRYQLSDLWLLGRGFPVNEKRLSLIDKEPNNHQSFSRTMALYCFGHPLEVTENQLHWPMWKYHSMTRPAVNGIRSSHVLPIYTHPSSTGQGYGCLVWSHTIVLNVYKDQRTKACALKEIKRMCLEESDFEKVS